MKDSKVKDIELERIRKETEMKAEAFYQKYNILPVQNENNCVIAPKEDEVFPSFTHVSYPTENQRGFSKRGDSPTTIPQQFQLL